MKIRRIFYVILLVLLLIFKKNIYHFTVNLIERSNFKIAKSKKSIYDQFSKYTEKVKYLQNPNEILVENEKLKKEIQLLKVKELKYENVLKENLEFRKYLNLNVNSEDKLIVANIFMIESFQNDDVIYINKGYQDGIKKYQLAIYDGKVIGRVNMVAKDYSEIYLISNPNFRLSVIVNDKFVGILRGKGQKEFSINNFDVNLSQNTRYFDIKTSGISKLYPKNLSLGTFRVNNEKTLKENRELKFSLDFLPESINTVLIYNENLEKFNLIDKIEKLHAEVK